MAPDPEHSLPTDVTPSVDRQLKAAQLAHDQMMVSWKDQTELAATLHERRKVSISVLAFVAALGVPKIGSNDGWSVLHDDPLLGPLIARCLVVAAGCFMMGMYRTCTNHSVIGRRVRGAWNWTLWTAIYLYQVARERDSQRRAALKPHRETPIDLNEFRACSRYVPDVSQQQSFFLAAPEDVLFVQTAQLRKAYDGLVTSNREVRIRLRDGGKLLCAGYVALALAFLLNLISITGR